MKEEIIPNTKSPQNNTISPKNSSASALNNIGNKLVSIFSKGSLDQFSNSNGPFSRETNKRTIIQTYIECRNCNEKLTRVQDLRILYLEYSFSEFLRHYFINEFSKDVNWEEFERNFEKNECPHYRKSRVFKLDEFLVKFYGGENRLYSIKKVNLLDKSVQEELALMNHKICIEKATELLDKISVIIEFLKKDIVDKKSFIRKPKPRSINLASVNPDNLVSPLKKKDLVHLISELDGIYKSLETHYADLKLRMDKVENYLEIEKNRIRSFYFFIGIVQRLSFMEEMIPKETKEDDNEGFTLRNLKRIFKFKQDLMSPSLNSNISKPTKSNINNNNNNQSDELARNSDFEDHILLKSNMEFSKSRFLKKTRFNTKVPPSKSRGHSKSDSCPNFNFIIKQFPLFLSEDDIKIPSKVVLSSLSKEKNNLPLVRNLSVFNKESKLIKIKEIKPDLFKKMKSYDIDVITTKVPVAKSTLLSNNDNKECNSTIKLKSELFSPEEPLENQNLNDEIVESSHNLKEEKEKVQIVLANCSLTRENGSEEGMEEDNNDEKANEDRSSSEHDEIYKNFNPNNLPKSKKYRMRSSGSIMIETQEWYILTDLLKGLCEAEQENEFKATKFYVL